MDINSIVVKMYRVDGFRAQCEGVTHIKTLPYFSIVQSVKGSYEISLGDNFPPQHTGDGGAFIAPSAVVQKIVHHVDPEIGFMDARWLFLDVVINDTERLDSRFQFPTVFPKEYLSELNRIFDSLSQSNGIYRDLSDIYFLLDVLIRSAKEKPDYDHLKEGIITYIDKHYQQKIIYSDFADEMHVSVSGLFRKVKKEFNEPPSCYINRYRILRAASLLENKNLSIKEIAMAVGFHDEFYFSKLFKHYMKIPPKSYREKISIRNV